MEARGKRFGLVLYAVVATFVLGSALAPLTLAAFASNGEDKEQKCKKHKYDGVCDKSSKDITCNILVPSANLVLHIGKAKQTGVSFTIQAFDPSDGIKKVRVHVTDDNVHAKSAVLGGDGFYHVAWTGLGKGDHHVQVTCTDLANNDRHDSVTVTIKK